MARPRAVSRMIFARRSVSPSLRLISPAASRLSSRRTTDEPSSDIDAARSFCRGASLARAMWTNGSQVASVKSKGCNRRSAARRH